LVDEAAQRFIEEHLELVGRANRGKEALYVCPSSGQLWLGDLPAGATAACDFGSFTSIPHGIR
jgi:hypothetical protein